jgi:hypothetical protein
VKIEPEITLFFVSSEEYNKAGGFDVFYDVNERKGEMYERTCLRGTLGKPGSRSAIGLRQRR